MDKKMIGLSMFSGGGIAETYFEEIGIHIAVANELVPERAKFYSHTHPTTTMIVEIFQTKPCLKLLWMLLKRKKYDSFWQLLPVKE